MARVYRGPPGMFSGGPAAVLCCFALLAASPPAFAQMPADPPAVDPNGVPANDVLPPPQPPPATAPDSPSGGSDPWTWKVLPDGLIYHSYLAAPKEPRFASQWLEDERAGSLWDITLGFRKALLRHGTDEPDRPQGFEVDFEGAASPRLLPGQSYDLMSVDFRFGIPITYGIGAYQTKLEVYHISSHLGDQFMIAHPAVDRIEYVWNGLGWGNSYYLTDNLRAYAEADWAYSTDGGAKPLEFEFGVEYSPVCPANSLRVAPFFALNEELTQSTHYSGTFVAQGGYQWRGTSGHLARIGVEYFVGKSDQYQFFNRHEQKVGIGIWYDF